MRIAHLFVSYAHVNLCHVFSSSWCQGLAATSACSSSCTFLFTFLNLKNERNFCFIGAYFLSITTVKNFSGGGYGK